MATNINLKPSPYQLGFNHHHHHNIPYSTPHTYNHRLRQQEYPLHIDQLVDHNKHKAGVFPDNGWHSNVVIFFQMPLELPDLLSVLFLGAIFLQYYRMPYYTIPNQKGFQAICHYMPLKLQTNQLPFHGQPIQA